MDLRVQIDTVSSSFQYRSALMTIYNQLRKSEFQTLKFLCGDFISGAKMEQIQNVLHLFTELEKLQKIGEPDNVMLLAEMLYLIGRSDQLETLCLKRETVAKSITERPLLDPFRVLLFKLGEQLTSNEVQDLLFINAALPKANKSKIEKPEELFQALEKHCLIVRDDLSNLIMMMKSINRSDLVAMVLKYNEKTGNSKMSLNFEVGSSVQLREESNPHLNIAFQDPRSCLISEARGLPSDKDALLKHNAFGAGLVEVQSCEDNNATGQSSVIIELKEDESVDLPCYPMTRIPRGCCVIINNEIFESIPGDETSRPLPNREGTQRDAQMLEELFKKKLKFQVIHYTNLKADEISKRLAYEAFKRDHSSFDCFVCCILSHGVLGSIYGVDGRTVVIRDLTNFFKGASCPTLCGKPKLFFIQACQGKDKQPGFSVVTDAPGSITPPESSEECNLVETIPNEADFLLGYATVPGYVSFRSKSQGSWYINALVQMLYKYANRYDLLSILIKVNEEVSRAIASMRDGTFKQSPMPVATLRKRIFFK